MDFEPCLYEIPTKLFAMGRIEEAGRYMYYFEEERETSLFSLLIQHSGYLVARPTDGQTLYVG